VNVTSGFGSARRQGRQLDLSLEKVASLAVPLLVVVCAGIAAAVLGDPTARRDALAWGLGAEGLIAGIARGRATVRGDRFADE